MLRNKRTHNAEQPPPKARDSHAVPLIGAGNTSGVQPYGTALNMDWKKYSMRLSPTLLAAVLIVLKMKMEMAMSAEERTMVYLRPTCGVR